jgi:hypothetical protein
MMPFYKDLFPSFNLSCDRRFIHKSSGGGVVRYGGKSSAVGDVSLSANPNKKHSIETQNQNEILREFKKKLGNLAEEIEGQKIIKEIESIEFRVPDGGTGLASLALALDRQMTEQYKSSLGASGGIFNHSDKPLGNINWGSKVRFTDAVGTTIETKLNDPDKILQKKLKPGMLVRFAKEGATNDLTIIVSTESSVSSNNEDSNQNEADPNKNEEVQKIQTAIDTYSTSMQVTYSQYGLDGSGWGNNVSIDDAFLLQIEVLDQAAATIESQSIVQTNTQLSASWAEKKQATAIQLAEIKAEVKAHQFYQGLIESVSLIEAQNYPLKQTDIASVQPLIDTYDGLAAMFSSMKEGNHTADYSVIPPNNTQVLSDQIALFVLGTEIQETVTAVKADEALFKDNKVKAISAENYIQAVKILDPVMGSDGKQDRFVAQKKSLQLANGNIEPSAKLESEDQTILDSLWNGLESFKQAEALKINIKRYFTTQLDTALSDENKTYTQAEIKQKQALIAHANLVVGRHNKITGAVKFTETEKKSITDLTARAKTAETRLSELYNKIIPAATIIETGAALELTTLPVDVSSVKIISSKIIDGKTIIISNDVSVKDKKLSIDTNALGLTEGNFKVQFFGSDNKKVWNGEANFSVGAIEKNSLGANDASERNKNNNDGSSETLKQKLNKVSLKNKKLTLTTPGKQMIEIKDLPVGVVDVKLRNKLSARSYGDTDGVIFNADKSGDYSGLEFDSTGIPEGDYELIFIDADGVENTPDVPVDFSFDVQDVSEPKKETAKKPSKKADGKSGSRPTWKDQQASIADLNDD